MYIEQALRAETDARFKHFLVPLGGAAEVEADASAYRASSTLIRMTSWSSNRVDWWPSSLPVDLMLSCVRQSDTR
jgi:hypothetical protein